MDVKLPVRLHYLQVGVLSKLFIGFIVTCCLSHNSRSFLSHFAFLTKSDISLLVPLENPAVKKKKISLEDA